jgi:hypothetical protein
LALTAEEAKDLRSDLVAMAERLVADCDWVPAGRVFATVAVCRAELARTGVHGRGLIDATEAMARSRIRAQAPDRPPGGHGVQPGRRRHPDGTSAAEA